MTPANTARAEPALSIIEVPTSLLRPNPWNPQAMDDEMFDRALRSIDDFGFVDPVTARPRDELYEIIDGEHRWRAAVRRQRPTVPVIALDVDDPTAKQLTIVLNEVRGQANPQKLALLLRDLLGTEPQETLLARLPLTRDALERLTGLPTMTFEGLPQALTPLAPGDRPSAWVERVYRLPKDAAETLDLAISRWREREDQRGQAPTADWRVLELICADWLAQ